MKNLSAPSFVSRRTVLQGTMFGGSSFADGSASRGTSSCKADGQERLSYATHAKGIRIFPGQWRPHYPFEHIAWVSPAWPS